MDAPFGAWKVLLIMRGKGGDKSILQGIRLPARSFVCLVFMHTDRLNILAITLVLVTFTSQEPQVITGGVEQERREHSRTLEQMVGEERCSYSTRDSQWDS